MKIENTYKYLILLLLLVLILFRIQIGYTNKIGYLKEELNQKIIENSELIKSVSYMGEVKKKLHSKPIYGWPIAVADYRRMTSEFGYRILMNPNTGGSRTSYHGGIDLVGTHHARVVSISDGVVIDNYLPPGWHHGKYYKGHPLLGGMIKIKNSDGTYAVYGHLSVTYVSEYGKRRIVEKGEVIGRTGNNGESTGEHLHFELRNRKDIAIQPLFFLKNPREVY